MLPAELGWTGRTAYDLDDTSDAVVLYERVLVDALRPQDMTPLINAERLRALWPDLFLPARVRLLWESRFPGLSSAAGGEDAVEAGRRARRSTSAKVASPPSPEHCDPSEGPGL